jgi:hypothetical protein
MFGNRLRGTLLIGSTLALLAGSGVASAQIRDRVVDDPPGTQFQTQANRQAEGRRDAPSVWSRTARMQRMQGYGAYAYAPRHIVVRHHRVVRHYHYYD